MNKKYRIGIVGATGAVGQELIELLFARDFPMSSLTLLASARSAGKKISHNGQTFTVEEAKPESFENLDIAIFPPARASRRFSFRRRQNADA